MAKSRKLERSAMMIGEFRCLSAAWVIFLSFATCFCVADRANAQAEGNIYEGVGETIFAARQEAIRIAIQERVKQLVVADRAVSDSDVIYDQIMSTMNGYVEEFEIISTEPGEDGTFQVRARIEISEGLIENTVAMRPNGPSEIDGEGLFKEIDKRDAQKEARILRMDANGYMYTRLFRGFPSEVISVEVKELSLSEVEDDTAFFVVQLVPDPAFVEAYVDTVQTLSIEKIVKNGQQNSPTIREKYSEAGVLSKAQICYGINAEFECHAPEPGVYSFGYDYRWSYPRPVFYIDLTDDTGVSVVDNGGCLRVDGMSIMRSSAWGLRDSLGDKYSMKVTTVFPFKHDFPGDNGAGGYAELTLDSFLTVLPIDLRRLDVRRAKNVNISVGFEVKSFKGMVDIFSVYEKEPGDGCEIARRGRRS